MGRKILLVFGIGICGFLKAEIPNGYYDEARFLKKVELKAALHCIVSQAKTLGYGGGKGRTWEGFYRVDRLDGDVVFDRYSDEKRRFENFASVKGMHIEHALPKSWWGGVEVNAYRDLHHLFPSDGRANQRKSNLPLGEVGVAKFDNGVCKVGENGFGDDYFGRCFEPADRFKGDFARAYFYISVAYEDLCGAWKSPMLNNSPYPNWEKWALELLRKWNKIDPVDEQEFRRMEAVSAIQGNRNPFVDFPDLVEYIWGADSLSAFPFYFYENQPIGFSFYQEF